MSDQVQRLKSLGIKAQFINSALSKREIAIALDNAVNDPNQKFLYIAPERIESLDFCERFRTMSVSLIAVDEAHCICQWGYDFRPSYLNIARLRDLRPEIPLLAVTATATKEVVSDILDKLRINVQSVVRSSVERSNLRLVVEETINKRNRILEWISMLPGSGILYCQTRKQVTDLSVFLKSKNISAEYYHAGLTVEERDGRQTDWQTGKLRIIVATSAFGMGIDKSDVRFVLHCALPENIESYYQESGRAGRDGQPATAVTLYEKSEVEELRRRILQKFPEVTTIRSIYGKLCQFLQIAEDAGKDETFTFLFNAFCDRYKLHPYVAYQTLKILDSLSFIQWIEKSVKTSLLKFIVSADELTLALSRDSVLEKVTQTFLRTHIGSFDGFVTVNEYMISQKTEISQDVVEQQFKKLASLHLADYRPAAGGSQLVFLQNRVDENRLHLSKEDYLLRKETAFSKMNKLIAFLETSSCKSSFLRFYFDDANTQPCGTCSSCEAARNRTLETKEVSDKILANLGSDFVSISEVIRVLHQYKRSDLIEQLRWLCDDGKVELDASGKKIRRLPV